MAPKSDWSDPANILKSSESFSTAISRIYSVMSWITQHTSRLVLRPRLPSSPAFTRIELYEKQKHEHTKRWYVAASVCIVMAVAFGVYNYAMQSIYKINMAEYETKKTQGRDLEQRIAELLKERLQRVPDDSLAIKKVDELLSYEPLLRSPSGTGQVNGFTAGHIFYTRPNFPVDLSKGRRDHGISKPKFRVSACSRSLN
jgi:hypothetical protein